MYKISEYILGDLIIITFEKFWKKKSVGIHNEFEDFGTDHGKSRDEK